MSVKKFLCREVKRAGKERNDFMRGYFVGQIHCEQNKIPLTDQRWHDYQSAMNEARFLRYPLTHNTRNGRETA